MNSSPLTNASGRLQTNSAPIANGTHANNHSNSRPLSSTGNHLTQNHFDSSHGGGHSRNSKGGPIIMRNLDKPSGVGTQVRLIKNTPTNPSSLNSSNYSVRFISLELARINYFLNYIFKLI